MMLRKLASPAIISLAFVAGMAFGPAANAGCVTGGAAGAAAGHMAGHHGKAGAAAGCVVGHHHANKKAETKQAQ